MEDHSAKPSIARRTLLKAAGVALASSALPIGMRFARAADRPAKKLIVVLNAGGWDTTYALDPKPGLSTVDAPEGAVKMFGEIPIFTHASRPAVDDFFTRFGDRSVVVRGLQVRSFVHPDCMKRLLTGSASETTPDFAAITAFELGRDLPVPYLALGGNARSGQFAAITGRTGTTNQLSALIDPAAAYPAKGSDIYLPDNGLVTTSDENGYVRSYLKASAERLRATVGQRGYNKKRLDDFVGSLDRSDRLREFAKQHGIGKREYTVDMKVQIPLAVGALHDGLSHAVMLQTDDWDTHTNNAKQSDQHQMLFGALSTLVDTLDAQNLFDDTLVVVVSEMGRTPKLNGEAGKDHWPVTSALLFGGGVRGGRALGASSDKLDAQSIDFATGSESASGQQLQATNFVAGILQAVGVAPEPYVGQAEPFTAFM